MKNHYLLRQRIRSAIVCLLLFSFFIVHTSFSQSQSGFDKGVVRIKVSEALAQQIEGARISRDANNNLVTGIQSLDQVNNQFKAKAIRRVFRPAGKFEAKHRRHGLHLWYEIQIDQAASVLSALNAYKTIPQIVISEPSYKKHIIGSNEKNFGPVVYKGDNALNTLPGASNDPLLGAQWHYNNTAQTGGTAGADISLFQAWGIETGRSEVIVAVTDGGVQVNHPDIAANMWVNTDEIPGNNIDDDNNGYIDDVNGYGFGDGIGTIAPDNHGTHVGGTIAAVTNNNVGVAGVAGGSGAGDGVRIMSCAAFGGTGTGGFADTYTYAADNGAVISQNSWGYTSPGVFEQAVLDGIDYFIAEAGLDQNGIQVGPMHGGLVVFAAGNSDSNEQHYPGFYDACFAVSGTTHKDEKAWYTNYGAWVEVAAPGGETNSVAQQGVLSTLANNQYGFFQGTSMACPHVSGLAALIISKYGGPGFTPNVVKARISSTTLNIDALNPGFEGLLGVGRINAFAALQEDDDVAPNAISDLSTTLPKITSLWVKWSAPSDPGTGAAFSYDLRYATSPITDANFESATAVTGEPTPGLPGTTQQIEITGLTPGTLYYFAIKSADFFGNTSAISNIAEGTTNFAPSIQVDPSSLAESLVTNEEKVRTIQVINNGDGPLQFTTRTLDGTHAQLTPANGTVPAHSALDVNVKLDAKRLLSGTYSSDFWILSNDESADSILYPVTLNVSNNGAPIADMPVTNLDFDTAYIGHVNSESLEIINLGSDTLIVDSVSSTDPNFQYAATQPVKVGPFETKLLDFVYEADSLGQWSSELTVFTNDPANPTILLLGYANVVDAPEIAVTPDSLYQQLNTNNTATQTLTITNSGGTDLLYTAEVGTGEAKIAAVTKTVTLPAKSPVTTSSARKNNISTTARAQAVRLKSVGQNAAVIRVLIVSPDDDVTDLETILDSFEDIEADVYPKADLPTFSATALIGYPVVITTNNTKWLENGGVDPALIGDELATYVEIIGGKVISNQFMYSYDDWKLAGRFIDEQFGPFIPSTTDENITTSLGTILQPSHPIMAGVNTLDYSGFVQNVGLAPGAIALANWANGELFAAANSNVVALNLLPSLGNGGALQWSGDLPTLYQNAIHYLAGPTFVSVAPEAGTIAAGSSADLTVTFDATNLDAGHYKAVIEIASNAPGAGLISVPAILDVLGPEFTISPDSIYAEVEKGETTSETFVLSNNGFGNFNYEISVVDKGVASVSVKKITPAKAARVATTKRTQASAARVNVDIDGTKAIIGGNANGRSITAAQLAVDQYATDFESFTEGDVTGQEGWAGQFGNWTIESVNASSGSQHFRGLADGFGLSLAFSPGVAIGSEEKSSVTMKVHRQDLGATWQIIPQSPSAGFLNTRVELSADGSARVLINDGAGNASFVPINAAVPLGYFDLTIEVDRATSEFKVYFNTTVVFEGLGFAGDIEQVVVLSLMEIAGPTLDVDDVRIIDGTKDFAPAYITVAPNSGALNAGESVEVTVTFDAAELAYGTYSAELLINIDGATELTLPTTLRVFGEPAIAVNPTVLQTTVPYKGDSVLTFDIQNTGGNPLDYSLQVIGAETDIKKLAKSPVSKFASIKEAERTTNKAAKDAGASREQVKNKSALEIRTGLPLFTEDFEDASFPPADWSVVDNAGGGVTWNFAAAYGEGNYSGTGEAATASSDAAGEVEFDTELISPWIDATGYKNIALQYNVNYQNFANRDFLNLDIQVAGSSSWTNVLSWNEDHGTLRGTQSEFVSLTLDEFLAGSTSFRVRWHYFDPQEGDFDWYAQVDDISILGDARAWLSVTPSSGTVPVRGTATLNALFDAEDIEPGFYVAGVLVRSNAVNTPLVGVVASLEVLRPAAINVEPDDLKQKLFVGEVATQYINIENQGESPLKFSFEPSANAGAPESARERVISKNTRTSKTPSTISADDRRAIIGGVTKLESSELYGTGFEEFAPGDINGQENWTGQFSNWTIESEKPAFGAQHFRGLADGLGQSLAFSPTVAVGTEAISSTTMKINIDGSGVTWQVIPQSPSVSFVNTRFEISADGSMRTLVDTLGGTYLPVPGTWPSGYNDLRIDIVRATKYFTIYLNNAPIFTGKGFAGDIEQVVILSAMEEAGPTMDIDNLAILDGTPASPWITVTPLSGTIESGSSINVAVTFNAQDLDKGQYSDTLNIASNDPATPWVQVPVFLTVDANTPPELAPIPSLTVLEKQIAQVTLTATDEDDSLVTVTIDNAPAFVTAAGSGNGTATFDIKPALGDAGEYHITVIATDGRGAADYDTLHISVLQFAVQSFSVVNIKTGQVIATFTDEVTLNRADANFNDLNIRANATPLTVGSVKFKVNGSQKNIDNTYEYFLKTNYLAGLGVGQYTLLGEPFTSMYGQGQRGVSKTAVVKIINASTVVTHFSLVNTSTGAVLQDFADSITIDASRSDFAQLNIRAHTAPTVVGSVKFKIDGTQRNIDNAITYDLKSQALQTLSNGWHTLLGEPWTQSFGQGQRGLGKTASIIIINSGSTNARVAQEGNAESTDLTVFPVPVVDQLTIDVAGKKIDGDVELVLVNTLGQLIHRVKVPSDKIHGYQISTNALGMVTGVYYLKLQSINFRQTKRFNKK